MSAKAAKHHARMRALPQNLVLSDPGPDLMFDDRVYKRGALTLYALRCEIGDGAQGFGDETYDVIVLTGSTPLLPDRLLAQLKPNGRLFAIVGEAPVMTARLVTWTAPGAHVTTTLFETVVAPLRHAATPDRFTLIGKPMPVEKDW